MRIDIVTLFPELCDSFLSASILGRARAKNLFEAHCHQIRDYTKNKQKQTDDYPYGGGCGMVLYAQPIADCLRAVQAQCAAQGRAKPHVVFLTAAGRPYNEEKARELAGSGTTVEDVNKLLRQFEMMQKMMKKVKRNPKGFMRGLGNLGSMGGFKGFGR